MGTMKFDNRFSESGLFIYRILKVIKMQILEENSDHALNSIVR